MLEASAPQLSRFLRVEDPELSAVADTLWDLKRALALQCTFFASCCNQARAAASSGPPNGKEKGNGGDGAASSVAIGIIDSGVPANALLISTRSPRRQRELAARGCAVFFDNALCADRSHVLLIAVLPSQLQDVARSFRPSARTLVLSLVGATPIAKIRTILAAPTAIASGAETLLPLLLDAQARQRRKAEEISSGVPATGRLPDAQLLQITSRAVAPDVPSVASLVGGVLTALSDLELPSGLAKREALAALFGEQPSDVLATITAELDHVGDELSGDDAEGMEGDGGSGPLDDRGWDSEAVARVRAAFVLHAKGGE
jgi:hypothetical protein